MHNKEDVDERQVCYLRVTVTDHIGIGIVTMNKEQERDQKWDRDRPQSVNEKGRCTTRERPYYRLQYG